MTTINEYLTGASADGWMFLLDAGIKSTVVLAAGVLASVALRRASAAARHWCWTLALSGVLVLPVLAAVLPAWQVTWLPRGYGPGVDDAGIDGVAAADAGGTGELSVASGMEMTSAAIATPGPLTAGNFTPPGLWKSGLLLTWFSGGLLAGVSLLAGIRRARRLVRQAAPANDDLWAEPLVEACDALQVKPNVGILQSPEIKVPMVWGCSRPVLLVPAEADGWPEARRRLVLLHELAHVKRGDCLTQLLARAACALYWFNPLAWLAAWRMRVERERACDDIVLWAGSKASEYADELLQITTSLPERKPAACAAIAMARRSTLEGRLLAILDRARNRRPLTNWAATASLILVACLLAPVAMLRGGEQSDSSRGRERHFVLLVIGQTNLTFQGQATTWENLPKLLAAVPNRDQTVLELATDTDTLTLAQFNPMQGRAAKLREQFGFEYLSLVGVHPLGSKGSPSMKIEARPGEAARGALPPEDQQWKQKLNQDQRSVLEWTERQFRNFFDNRTFTGLTETELTELETRLLDTLKGPLTREYYQAINTLGALRSGKAVGPLLAIATERREKDNRDRWMAIRALGMISEQSVVPELIHLVYYPNLSTRWWAQLSLVRLSGQNFGKDWEAWGRWWNEQNGAPRFNPEKIAWSSNPEWTDPKNIEEGDRKFLEQLKQ